MPLEPERANSNQPLKYAYFANIHVLIIVEGILFKLIKLKSRAKYVNFSIVVAHDVLSSMLPLVPMLRFYFFKQFETHCTSSYNFSRVASHVPEVQRLHSFSCL